MLTNIITCDEWCLISIAQKFSKRPLHYRKFPFFHFFFFSLFSWMGRNNIWWKHKSTLLLCLAYIVVTNIWMTLFFFLIWFFIYLLVFIIFISTACKVRMWNGWRIGSWDNSFLANGKHEITFVSIKKLWLIFFDIIFFLKQNPNIISNHDEQYPTARMENPTYRSLHDHALEKIAKLGKLWATLLSSRRIWEKSNTTCFFNLIFHIIDL